MRHAIRVLLHSPIFATVAVLSLAVGIGANTAIFSLINAVILRPLPVHEPERLVILTRLTGPDSWFSAAYPLYREVEDNNHVFAGVLASGDWTVEMTTNQAGRVGSDSVASVRLVSANYFSLLGVPTLLGRPLQQETDSVAVISYSTWTNEFQRRPDI